MPLQSLALLGCLPQLLTISIFFFGFNAPAALLSLFFLVIIIVLFIRSLFVTITSLARITAPHSLSHFHSQHITFTILHCTSFIRSRRIFVPFSLYFYSFFQLFIRLIISVTGFGPFGTVTVILLLLSLALILYCVCLHYSASLLSCLFCLRVRPVARR